jgi:hypothetical protein
LKYLSIFIAATATATIVHALPASPAVSWSVSTDGGTTWSSNAVRNTPGTVLVRARLGWHETGSGTAGLGAALASFDGTLTGLDAADSATGFTKHLVPVGDTQAVVFSRNGSDGKIDDSTDTAAAGAGTRWVVTGQAIPQIQGFNTDNPVTLFSYELNIGGADHEVNIDCILNGGANQAVRIYLTAFGGTSGGGQFSRDQVLVNGARVSLVTPVPSTFSIISLGGIVATRRRRASCRI